MSLRAAVQAIEQAVETAWIDALQPAANIAWPNLPFTPSTTPFLQVDITWQRGIRETAALDQLNRVFGVLQLTVYGDLDAGDGALQTLVDSMRAALNRAVLGSVHMNVASGPQPDNTEGYRVNIVTIPFEVEE